MRASFAQKPKGTRSQKVTDTRKHDHFLRSYLIEHLNPRSSVPSLNSPLFLHTFLHANRTGTLKIIYGVPVTGGIRHAWNSCNKYPGLRRCGIAHLVLLSKRNCKKLLMICTRVKKSSNSISHPLHLSHRCPLWPRSRWFCFRYI